MPFFNPGAAVDACFDFMKKMRERNIFPTKENAVAHLKAKVCAQPRIFGFSEGVPTPQELESIVFAWEYLLDLCANADDVWFGSKSLPDIPSLADLFYVSKGKLHIVEVKVTAQADEKLSESTKKKMKRQIRSSLEYVKEAGIKMPIACWGLVFLYRSRIGDLVVAEKNGVRSYRLIGHAEPEWIKIDEYPAN